ncbi:MAG: pyridoxamine 5'-phosphate oxidase [Pseudomonadales bacterium]
MTNEQSEKLLAEALQKMRDALDEAVACDAPEPYIMSLATVDANGKPSVRSIMLANVNEHGLLFFVNKKSGKGIQLMNNPNVAMCFFWPSLNLQVIVDGIARQESGDEANRIWSKRARANQLAAWASQQSEESLGRQALASRVAETKQAFRDEHVPLPDHWAGYRVLPTRIEFWHTGWQHLKDRVRYKKDGEDWIKTMLNP